MRVATYNLDGLPQGDADLTRDAQGHVSLDGMPVLAVSPWGSKVALTLQRRLVLIDMHAYGQLATSKGLPKEQ